MEKKKKKRGRRAHLDDFKKNFRGEWVYTGCHYSLAGQSVKADIRRSIALFHTGILATALLPECLPAVEMSDCIWAVLPWVLQAVSVFLTLWTAVRLIFAGTRVRAYVYERTVPVLPRRLMLTVLTAALAFILESLYLILNGVGSKPFFSAARPVLSLVCAVAALFARKSFLSYTWEKEEQK